jgi:hypothetical protein
MKMTQSRELSAAQEMRLFTGFVVQPFAAAVLGFIAFPLIDISGRALYDGRAPTDPMDAAISIALGAGFAAFFVTLCGAFPVVVWLLKRGPLTLKQVLWGGAILGNVPLAIIVPLAAIARSPDADASWFGPIAMVRAVSVGAIFGIAGATSFWAVSIRGTAMERRPVSRKKHAG